jgi:CHASE2 domain-containing sensor protein
LRRNGVKEGANMTALVVILLILALLLGGIGLFVEGLIWLVIIAAVLVVASFVVRSVGGRA